MGVRGIKLRKNDELEQIYLFYEGTEHKISYGDRELDVEPAEGCKNVTGPERRLGVKSENSGSNHAGHL